MEVYRLTFRIILYVAIQQREQLEKELGFTTDSAYLALMREMLIETDLGEFTIDIKD